MNANTQIFFDAQLFLRTNFRSTLFIKTLRITSTNIITFNTLILITFLDNYEIKSELYYCWIFLWFISLVWFDSFASKQTMVPEMFWYHMISFYPDIFQVAPFHGNRPFFRSLKCPILKTVLLFLQDICRYILSYEVYVTILLVNETKLKRKILIKIYYCILWMHVPTFPVLLLNFMVVFFVVSNQFLRQRKLHIILNVCDFITFALCFQFFKLQWAWYFIH